MSCYLNLDTNLIMQIKELNIEPGRAICYSGFREGQGPGSQATVNVLQHRHARHDPALAPEPDRQEVRR